MSGKTAELKLKYLQYPYMPTKNDSKPSSISSVGSFNNNVSFLFFSFPFFVFQIYADEVAYIFDVQSLGIDLFNHGHGNLGEIIESHSIVKV